MIVQSFLDRVPATEAGLIRFKLWFPRKAMQLYNGRNVMLFFIYIFSLLLFIHCTFSQLKFTSYDSSEFFR